MFEQSGRVAETWMKKKKLKSMTHGEIILDQPFEII